MAPARPRASAKLLAKRLASVKTLANGRRRHACLAYTQQTGAPAHAHVVPVRARCRLRRMRLHAAARTLQRTMSSNAFEHLKVDRRGALLDVTLNRPKKLNALNLDMVRELQSAFDAAEASQGCVALALRGEGERAFCAGGDIVAVRAAGLEDKPTTPFFREEYALNARTGALRESRVVQCSFWDGFTFGGGVGLSVHGKYRIATEKTQLAMSATVHKSNVAVVLRLTG